MFSLFVTRIVLKRDNLGKRVWQRGPKGGIYSIHLFDYRPCSPFCYKICIERGQPGKRVWRKGGHIFYTFICSSIGFSLFVIRFVLKEDNLEKGFGQRGAYILYIYLFID